MQLSGSPSLRGHGNEEASQARPTEPQRMIGNRQSRVCYEPNAGRVASTSKSTSLTRPAHSSKTAQKTPNSLIATETGRSLAGLGPPIENHHCRLTRAFASS